MQNTQNIITDILRINSSYTLQEHNTALIVDTTAGDVTITLPDNTSFPSDGFIRKYNIWHNQGNNNLILQIANGRAFSNGSTSINLGAFKNVFNVLVSNDGNYSVWTVNTPQLLTELASLNVGDVSSGDYLEISSEGSSRLRGDATAWKDMIANLFGRRLNSILGAIDYDYDENAIVFSPNGSITNRNDRIGGNQEINHEMKVGSSITFKPHIHWWQQVTSGAVLPIVFTARYRLQRNGFAKVTSWTTITANAGTVDDVFDFTTEADGLYNQITRFDDITIDCGISDMIQFQLTRTDAQAGNVAATFFDTHGEVDSFGSEQEIIKVV